jgi:hypothetical protein
MSNHSKQTDANWPSALLQGIWEANSRLTRWTQIAASLSTMAALGGAQSPTARPCIMAKKRDKVEDNFVFFDVVYEDGTKSSRRKINATGVDEDDLEAFAKTEIMNQDRRIAEMSGKSRGQVKSLARAG